jgi:hypothetical protein
MRAGDIVRALDVPPSNVNINSATMSNFSNTVFEPGDPELSMTFIAPTSGAVLIFVGGGLRDNSGTNRIHMAPEVRVNNLLGNVVLYPGISANSWTNSAFQTAQYQYSSRMVPLSSLIPGQRYFARVMISVTSGSTADVFNQQLFVVPTAG